MLGYTIISKKVFYTNADPPTRHEKYVEEMEYIRTTKLISNKGEVAKLIHMWHPD